MSKKGILATGGRRRDASKCLVTNVDSSAFVPGTTAYKYAQGRKVLYMAQDKAEMVERLTIEYTKILGFMK